MKTIITITINTIILLFTSLSSPSRAFSFNAYDLGFRGLYPRQYFQSTDLQPPVMRIDRWDSRCDEGYLLLTPRGPLVTGSARGPVVMDSRGELIWMDHTRWSQAMGLNVQRFRGEDYLTFWTESGEGVKSFVMLDSSYEVAYRISPKGKGCKGDSHEFRITPQGTALIAIYHKQRMDCTDFHLGERCWVQDGWFQEVDIATGDLLFEWHASDHISMKDVYSTPSRKDGHGGSKSDAFDYFHLNAIDKTDDGDYLLSARYLHAVICVSGKTGEILWQLGGKKNDFTTSTGALDFAWQHHVTWQGNNTISLFDNHANTVLHRPSIHSKGMLISLDREKMRATLLGAYVHPDDILNVSQGSVQVLPATGNLLVGFGNSPTFVEFSQEGEVLCSAHYAPHVDYEVMDFGLVKSYRVFKSAWVGRPDTRPEVRVVDDGTVYVSWNGATEVRSWRLESSASRDGRGDGDGFVTVQELERVGFETAFGFEGGKMSHRYVRVVALDSEGKVLVRSDVVERRRRLHLLWIGSLLVGMFILAVVLTIIYRRRAWRRRSCDGLVVDGGGTGERGRRSWSAISRFSWLFWSTERRDQRRGGLEEEIDEDEDDDRMPLLEARGHDV